jgi:predicted CXXCH cytochrome family protein
MPLLHSSERSRRLRLGLLAAFVFLLCAAAVFHHSVTPPAVHAAEVTPSLANPDAACARCHAEIYRRYELTPMARGSGNAPAGFLPGEFHHPQSNVSYRIFERDGAVWMSFDRPASDPRGALSGERRLSYYLGSNHRGRTFLYSMQGLWFELPVNYYAKQNLWDMTPNYGNVTRMPAPLPVGPNCLHCHSTGVAAPLPGARNLFAAAPFAQGGIGCSSCHGDARQHLATRGKAPLLNPATLAAPQRDSVCIQCHLEGDAVVFRTGRSLATFHPGDDLRDDAVYFVRSSQATGGARATSQYEALLQSACKRASGDRLTCTTCHDPHDSPTPANRVSYFRARCLSCHTSPAMATHHPEQPDCASCHMPSSTTTDISHEQVTDHNIERVPVALPSAHGAPLAPSETLVPVGSVSFGDRELGLAYAQLARRGDRLAGERALALLTRAEADGSADDQLHVNLGFLDQVSGHTAAARTEYTAALAANPFEPAALTNLAVLDAGSGQPAEAVRLLSRLIAVDPSQTSAGLDLAFLQCSLGDPAKARSTAQRLLALNPDSAAVRAFLASGAYANARCAAIAASTP